MLKAGVRLAGIDGPEDTRPGDLELHVRRREVRVDGVAVPLGGRALDILQILIEASGGVVAKPDLISRIWPDHAMNDNALQAQISAIRQALGASRTLLRTVSGRGYQLLGYWTVRSDAVGAAVPKPGQPARPSVFQSGECEIDLAQRELRVAGAAVPVGSRAFDILATLIEEANEVVPKSLLLERVWAGVTVGDTAIDVHVSAIRKALGPYRTLLKTVSGRGYRLGGGWTMLDGGGSTPAPMPLRRTAASTNLPEAFDTLIGREESIQHLHQALSAYRIVTLTGPGGIGKTSLAIELARRLLPSFDAGVWLVELVSSADPSLVPLAAGEVIGLQSGGGQMSADAVAKAIGDRRLLLVLDNCEHLIGAAEQLAATIIRIAPNAVVLTTSRETLRTPGEYVYSVPPLDVPQNDADRTAADILGNSAIQLFLSRAEALQMTDLRDERGLRLIVGICRRLDGIPLAIEFAASRAASLGLLQVSRGLADRFTLLTTGRRTALPRHQTLRAVLDWSYELLPEAERRSLRRLAIFPGGFVFDAACAVLGVRSSGAVADSIAGLVGKSMVTIDRAVPSGRWRLLETVRAYALEKLTSDGEHTQTAYRHAAFCRDLFNSFDLNAGPEDGVEDLPRYMREVDSLRAALTWAFSGSGDTALGAALAAAAVNFWLAASLLDECCFWTNAALHRQEAVDPPRLEMTLRGGLGLGLLFTAGMTDAAHVNLTRALTLAEVCGSVEYQERAVYGLWLFAARSMELRKALELGRRYAAFGRGDDPAAMHTADLMTGTALTYLGAFRDAICTLERAVHNYPAGRRYRDMARHGIDLPSSAFNHLSLCLLSLGLIDAAIVASRHSVEEAMQVGQPVALCLALAWSTSLNLLETGSFEAAERQIDSMLEEADRHALDTFHALAICARGRLIAKRSDPAAAVKVLRSGLTQLDKAGYDLFGTFFHGCLAEALAAAGSHSEALTEAEAVRRHAERNGYLWFVPELLRIHASVIARRAPNDPAAEAMFRQAIDLAHGQQALYWELNAAMSLAELWRSQGRDVEARTLVAPIRQRFTEGLSAPLLIRADALLASI
jgi:non-specific serine/threonine protein kinase